MPQPAQIVKQNQEHKLTLSVLTHVLHLGNLLYFQQGVLVVEQKAQDSLTHFLVSEPSREVLIEGHQFVGEVNLLAALDLVHLVLRGPQIRVALVLRQSSSNHGGNRFSRKPVFVVRIETVFDDGVDGCGQSLNIGLNSILIVSDDLALLVVEVGHGQALVVDALPLENPHENHA